jgi:hypothetical protein
MLNKTWWLLALCGIVDAIHAGTNLLMLNPEGSFALRRYARPNAITDMGMLALAAGACAVAVGVCNLGRSRSWLLSMHGLALGAFGLLAVSPLVKGALSFRPISLLFVVMAASTGAFALATAQTVKGSLPRMQIWSLAGAASIAFACSFFLVGFGWVRLGQPQYFWWWMSSYFAYCAIFMLCLAGRTHGFRAERANLTTSPLHGPVIL